MKNTRNGFTLIEVLVALIVLGVGLLGVALFSSDLLSESGRSKARAEAVQLAQQRVEQIREEALVMSVSSLAASSVVVVDTEVTGRNAVFDVSASGSAVSNNLLNAEVVVSWTDSTGDAQLLKLHSKITDSFINATNTNAGSGGGGANPYAIDMPTGEAEYGDDAPGGVLTNPSILNSNLEVVTSGGKVSVVYNDPVEGELELLNLDSSNGNVSFSEIRGTVYVDYSTTGLAATEENAASIVVRASDTGICPHTSPIIPSGADAGDWLMEYRCFFGAGWYGNISVIYLDNDGADISETVDTCVGDPVGSYVFDINDDLTPYPNWMLAKDPKREYRGYSLSYTEGGSTLADESGFAFLISRGMGRNEIYGIGDIPSGAKEIIGDGDHDFFLTTGHGYSNGTMNNLPQEELAVDSDDILVHKRLSDICKARTEVVSVSYPSVLSSGSNVSIDEFEDNNGDFICLQDGNGYTSCPYSIPSFAAQVETYVINISGSVSGALSGDNTLTSRTSQFPDTTASFCTKDGNGDLQCASVDICSHSAGSYECLAYVASGSTWSGSIFHTISGAGDSVCRNGADASELSYSGLSSSVTSESIDIVNSDSCTGTGTGGGACTIDDWSWNSPAASNTSALNWSTSSCADVKLYSCIEDKNSVCTPTTANTQESSAVSGSESVGATVSADANSTHCYKLFADTETSAVNCMRNKTSGPNTTLSFP